MTARGGTTRPHTIVEEQLRRRVHEGTWAAGTMIPGRRALARTFGVAVNTVNRAIADLVEEGVLQTDDRRGTFVAHQPAPAARMPSGAPARAASVGVVAAYSEERTPGNWAIAVLDALEQYVSSQGGRTRVYNVYFSSPRTYKTPGEAIEAALADGVHALVVSSVNTYPGWEEETVAATRDARCPVVCAWYRDMRAALPHVHMDQFAAGRLAAEHLLDSGYEKGIFVATYTADWLEERIAGARSAFEERGLSFATAPDRTSMSAHEFDKKHGKRSHQAFAKAVEGGLKRAGVAKAPAGTCAVIGASDREARTAHAVITARGMEPGTDVGIIGFDDSAESRELGLSSMRPPLEELGQTAARLALDGLSGRPLPTKTGMSPHLLARASTLRAAGGDR